ncbi:hypothetical protein F2P81_022827 [Scophthalmus maximus]|uniref:Uncharacterized protein n=1 Tax=Scophthalmus maximus TaxID=52904 RepID=A0A6A4RTD8_SCOMX|nr:hypothetical protein F2P81_022827 [Scophthalmus maximus]
MASTMWVNGRGVLRLFDRLALQRERRRVESELRLDFNKTNLSPTRGHRTNDTMKVEDDPRRLDHSASASSYKVYMLIEEYPNL